MLSLLTWPIKIWYNVHCPRQHMQWQLSFRKKKSYVGCALENDFIIPYWKDLWLFSFLFPLLFYFLCSSHCSFSSMIIFSSLVVYFLLYVVCVHGFPTCASHCNSSTCYHAWKTFFICSKVASAPPLLTNLWHMTHF